MKNIVFLGSKKIGAECLRFLVNNKESLGIKLSGVLTNKKGSEIVRICDEYGIPIINSLDNFLRIDSVDITISVQYHEILKREHIEKAKEITINLHMAPLPEYRGCNQFSFAIKNNDKIFGTTIHRLEEGIDSGDIIFEKRFSIPNNIWVKELYELTFQHSINLFRESIPYIINGNYSLTPQKEYSEIRKSSFHLRNEIDHLKRINLKDSCFKIEQQIKATYMPGFEPPFIIIGNKKMYFVIEDEYKNPKK